ncbi:MAG: hypothetical protein C0459_12215 [Chitinophaga sp.]|jgi:hypothetical protein|nr:hypothetical protein [Chitinophaga sp.]
MKKIISLLLLTTIIISSCKQEEKKETNDKKETTASVTLPYPILYSSEFEIGDKKFAKLVLDIWKDYDNNTIKNSAALFADTTRFYDASGRMVKGKDSIISIIDTYRNSIASVKEDVSAIVVLKPKGKDETWVCVWGKEVDAMKDGKKDSVFLQESWMFNKDEKVANIYQYATKPK